MSSRVLLEEYTAESVTVWRQVEETVITVLRFYTEQTASKVDPSILKST